MYIILELRYVWIFTHFVDFWLVDEDNFW